MAAVDKNGTLICKKIKDSGKNALMPYSRQKGRKDKELMQCFKSCFKSCFFTKPVISS